MRLFGHSIKNGTPVFILRGTGGCANKAALVHPLSPWIGGGNVTKFDPDKALKLIASGQVDFL